MRRKNVDGDTGGVVSFLRLILQPVLRLIIVMLLYLIFGGNFSGVVFSLFAFSSSASTTSVH